MSDEWSPDARILHRPIAMNTIDDAPMLQSVTAIVVTHNRPVLLRAALDALKSQTMSLHAIVVVDNASDPETVLLLQGETNLVVLRMEYNLGGSGGFAAGVEQALSMSGEWIWLVDDDAILHRAALENLLCDQNNIDYNAADLAVLCPAVEEGGELALMHRRYFDPNTLRESVVPRHKYSEKVVEIDAASFVGFLVKADAIRHVGLPDARFFLGYDDIELSLRLKQSGYRLFLLPASRVDHRHASGARLRHGPFGIKHYYNLRNRFIVYRKFGHARAWRWLSPFTQGLMLLLIAGRGRPTSLKWWWRAMRDARTEPQVATRQCAETDAVKVPTKR